MRPPVLLSILVMTTLSAVAQTTMKSSEEFNYYLHQSPNHPITVDPRKWAQQPKVNSWDSMEQATNEAMKNRDGYGLYQLAYLEYVNNFTASKLNPKTMLYRAFEMGTANNDPYLMYWITEFEGTAYFHFEYLQRRRNHAQCTDSIATINKDYYILNRLADLNDKCFTQIKSLAKQYIQCSYLKDETYGLLPYDIRPKALELEKMQSKNK